MKKTLSKSSPYYISEYRRKELEYYCLQYDEWKKMLSQLDGYSSLHKSIIDVSKKSTTENLQSLIEKRELYLKKIESVDNAIKQLGICSTLMGDILIHVTTQYSYDKMNARKPIPCGRRQFYDYVRQFYRILDNYKS